MNHLKIKNMNVTAFSFYATLVLVAFGFVINFEVAPVWLPVIMVVALFFNGLKAYQGLKGKSDKEVARILGIPATLLKM